MLMSNETSSADAILGQHVRDNISDSRLNLILAGFPKCGTTSFAHWLGESTQIAVTNPKETFLLCREHRRAGAVAPEGSLVKCFADTNKPLRLEASTLNVYSNVLLDELESLAHIKVILSYRDPLESVVSWHNQVVQAGEAFDPDIATCWRHCVSARMQSNSDNELGIDSIPLMQNYALVCEFGHWMDKWQQAIGHERLLLVKAAELQGDCAGLRRRLNAFLGADLQLPPSPPVLNSYASIRFESFYKKFKRSFFNQRLRDFERYFPFASTLRRTMKEKFFRKSIRKESHEALKTALAAYYTADIARSTRLYNENHQHWAK